MYPVSYAADVPIEGRDRLSAGLRLLYGIPVLIVAWLYGIGASIAAVIAWFSIVFTGKYPDGLYDFNAKYVRLSARANSYLFLTTDESPPLNGEPDDKYPVRIDMPEQLAEYDRLKTGLRFLYGIPVALLGYVQAIIAEVIAVIAWFSVVFTGKFPDGLVKPLSSALSYTTKASAYWLLITEDWPEFSDDSAGEAVGEIASTSASRQ